MSLVLGSLLPAFMKCPLKIKIGQIKTTLKGNASSLQYTHTHTPLHALPATDFSLLKFSLQMNQLVRSDPSRMRSFNLGLQKEASNQEFLQK